MGKQKSDSGVEIIRYIECVIATSVLSPPQLCNLRVDRLERGNNNGQYSFFFLTGLAISDR